jgi:multiple sugar transport system permease protein
MIKMKSNLTPYFLLLPALVVLFVIVIYPFLYSLYTSFHYWYLASPKPPVFVGLKNYIDILTSNEMRFSFFITVRFFIISIAMQMLIGLGLGFFLNNKYLLWPKFFRSLFIIPMMIAPAVVATVWRMMYHPSYGVLTYLASIFGINDIGWVQKPGIALYSISLVEIWQWSPFIALITLAGLQTLPISILEAARVDGATTAQIFWNVKLPLMRPFIALAFIIRFIFSFRVFESFRIITKGGPGTATDVLMHKLYLKGFQYMMIGEASALAFLILAVITILAMASFTWLFPSLKPGGELK